MFENRYRTVFLNMNTNYSLKEGIYLILLLKFKAITITQQLHKFIKMYVHNFKFKKIKYEWKIEDKKRCSSVIKIQIRYKILKSIY